MHCEALKDNFRKNWKIWSTVRMALQRLLTHLILMKIVWVCITYVLLYKYKSTPHKQGLKHPALAYMNPATLSQNCFLFEGDTALD